MSGFTSGMRSSLSDEWTTPRDLFDELNAEFHFDLDAASTDENALCERHYTKDDDGLSQPWEGSVWCNPPYGRQVGEWVRKAAESNRGGVTVMLLPARTETRWWVDWVVGYATEIRFVKGRLKFGDSGNSAPFPSAVVIYDRRPSRYWIVRR